MLLDGVSSLPQYSFICDVYSVYFFGFLVWESHPDMPTPGSMFRNHFRQDSGDHMQCNKLNAGLPHAIKEHYLTYRVAFYKSSILLYWVVQSAIT